MKLGLRKPRRKHSRGHGDVPAPPKPVAVAYQGGREIRVYEAPGGRYYPIVAGAGTRAGMCGTIREAVAEGRRLTEAMVTRSAAAYSRQTHAPRERRGRR
jgi:hypothetical protein